MLLAAVAGCVGAITHLYLRLERQHKETVGRLDLCERDRMELWKRIADMAILAARGKTEP